LTSRNTSIALNVLVFVEVGIAVLFLPLLAFLIMATVGSVDRDAAATFANAVTLYGALLIALIIGLIWSALRTKHRLVAAGIGAMILLAPFCAVSRELGYRLAEQAIG
jgi:hypothetical protein